jgi:hypothetical protein
VTVSISAVLVSGDEYRIGFFGDFGTATFFVPASFPYTETSGLLRINGACDGPFDSFPSNPNAFDPLISLQMSTVPEHGSMATAGIAVLGVLAFRRCLHRQIAPCA